MKYLPAITVKRADWRFRQVCLAFWNGILIGDSRCDISVPDCPDGVQAVLVLSSGGADLRASTPSTTVSRTEKGPDLFFDVSSQGTIRFQVHLRNRTGNDIPQFDRSVVLSPNSRIGVGCGQNNELVYTASEGPDTWLNLICDGSSVTAEPAARIQGGLWLNNRRLDGKKLLRTGDFLTCCGMHIQRTKNGLLVCSNEMAFCRLEYIDEKEQKSHLSYPKITRTSREIAFLNTDEIKVLDPPAPIMPERNRLLVSLLPSVTMLMLTFALRSSFANNSSMIMFSSLSMGVGGISAAANHFTARKENKKKTIKRENGYRQYIEKCDRQIQTERTRETDARRRIYVTPKEEIRRIRDFSAELFDRSITDADFLELYLGSGTVDSCRQVTYASHEKFEAIDDLFQLAPALAEKYRKVQNVPVTLKTNQSNAIGFVGNIQRSREFLRNLILDLAARHYFGDVKLFAFLGNAFLSEVSAFHMLPHFYDPEIDRRFISHDAESNAELTETLYRILSARDQAEKKPKDVPWIVVLAEERSVLEHPLMQFVPRAKELRCLFLFFVRYTEFLPQGCSDKVLLFNNRSSGAVIPLDHASPDLLFDYQAISLDELQTASERLAPVFAGTLDLASELPSDISLMQLLGVSDFQSRQILKNWSASNAVKSLAAPLGRMENGKIQTLDIHEAVHGPHGLVAGTTGSGKSQVLISYILSMASRFSPEDVTFAVIDFKGGDIVRHLEGLPHIIGSITNLDNRELDRSLKFINAEKNRRMQLFADSRVKAGNISEYITAYRKGLTDVPLPHLVIIVDEFAELRQQRPDFMADLISLSRVGRSLGIHLILCTQKPSGVVDAQMWGNTDFHLSLRVQSREDSNEVIKSPLAAEIRVPGRGYLQVSRTETFSLFQSGYSGGLFSENRESAQPYTISERSLSGRRTTLYAHKGEKKEGQTHAQVMLEAIKQAFESSGLAVPRPLCVPPIPLSVPFASWRGEKRYTVCIGMYDDPDHQAVEPLLLDLSGLNTLIVGGVQMGKTNLLQTVIRGLAETEKEEPARIYALDFNANALKNMEDMDLISGVVMADEEEKLRSLLRLLKDEIGRRKSRMMETRFTGFEAYSEVHRDMSLIVVMIDNVAVFKELYGERLTDMLIYLMREGPSLGISFLVTASHMADLPFKMAHCFDERIAMPLSERSEYMSVFDGCRQEVLNTPGRVLVKRDKTFYEGQVYLAFEGETEADRSAAMLDCIARHRTGKKNAPIPEIPGVLSWSYMRSLNTVRSDIHFPLGMVFRTVQPVYAMLEKDFSLSVSGGIEKEIQRVIAFFTEFAVSLAKEGKAQVYVLDDYSRTLSPFSSGISYTVEPDTADEYLAGVKQTLEERRAKRREGVQDAAAPIVFILNGPDSILSLKATSVTHIRDIAEKYRREGIFFLFGGVPNKQVTYASPDIMKFIRDEKHVLLFDEITSSRLVDVSPITARENNRPLGTGEAFLFWGDDLERVRVPDINDGNGE